MHPGEGQVRFWAFRRPFRGDQAHPCFHSSGMPGHEHIHGMGFDQGNGRFIILRIDGMLNRRTGHAGLHVPAAGAAVQLGRFIPVLRFLAVTQQAGK